MKKVLVIDDDADILEVVKMILTLKGYAVFTHKNGYNVPPLVKNIEPDIILLDIMLPGKLGTDICKELKEISKLPPILLFSAHAKEGQSFAECKADGFISKPFDVNDLISQIEKNLK